MGVVLLQEQEHKVLIPIGYWSWSLCNANTGYNTSRKKCVAVAWAVFLLSLYLRGTQPVIRTNHQNLRWILDLKKWTRRLACWRLRLIEFDFEITHRTRFYHQTADTISRLPKEVLPDESAVYNNISTFSIIGQNSAVCSTIIDCYSTALAMPMPKEIFDSQQSYVFLQDMQKFVQWSDSRFTVDENGLVYWDALLDGSSQAVVTEALCRVVHYNSRHPVTAGPQA